MRSAAEVLHLDMDAFYAAVEQRDKPSLRGRPVVVGGTGGRGVVATASYEARVFGVRSAMPTHEARRRCSHAAYLSPRFEAYRESSERVMAVLRELSPKVEPLSLDEAFVDLAAARTPVDTDPAALAVLVDSLRSRIAEVTGGLTASVGVATSKLMAKVSSELAKPDGQRVVPPGSEAATLAPLSVRVIPGVGPVTYDRLHRNGLRTVADLQATGVDELVQLLGRSAGETLAALAVGADDRAVESEREAKSISVEDTFEADLTSRAELERIAGRQAAQVAERLSAGGLFARTVTIKVRFGDFSTHTRSRTLRGATDRVAVVAETAVALLAGVDTTDGLRLLGVGVAGLTTVVQEDLFSVEDVAEPASEPTPDPSPEATPDGTVATSEAGVADAVDVEPAVTGWERRRGDWPTGADVEHEDLGRGWVWGSGRGRVTVRFETRDSGRGPVRTFGTDDEGLRRVPPDPLPGPPSSGSTASPNFLGSDVSVADKDAPAL